MLIDPTRDFVPVHFQTTRNAGFIDELSIKYVPDRTIGFRVSEWSDKVVYHSGAITSRSCKVMHCSINKPLGDDVFAIHFPKGAEVVQIDGEQRRYYVIVDDQESLRPIPEEEFGN